MEAKLLHADAAAKRNLAPRHQTAGIATNPDSITVWSVNRPAPDRVESFAKGWLAAAAGLLLAGCVSGTQAPAGVRAKIESSGVAIGASAASVLSTLGEPQLRQAPRGGPAGSERWIYIERTIESAGIITVGRYETLYDRENRLYSHFIVPEDRDQFVTRARVAAVLTFFDGGLVGIDFPNG